MWFLYDNILKIKAPCSEKEKNSCILQWQMALATMKWTKQQWRKTYHVIDESHPSRKKHFICFYIGLWLDDPLIHWLRQWVKDGTETWVKKVFHKLTYKKRIVNIVIVGWVNGPWQLLCEIQVTCLPLKSCKNNQYTQVLAHTLKQKIQVCCELRFKFLVNSYRKS